VHGLPPRGVGHRKTPAQNRAEKKCRVREGQAHAALVYDGATCVGWCQFGSPDELPRIKNQRDYREGLTVLSDWRITCFFVDKAYRGQGVTSAALAGALDEIARLGGGTVESYPEDVAGRTVSRSFLHNATVSLFERHGFGRTRRLGKNRWVVTKVARPRRSASPT
jgi:GNAT superfamily N-acetyltransferase